MRILFRLVPAVFATGALAASALAAATTLTRPTDRTVEIRRFAAAAPGAGPAGIAQAVVMGVRRQVAGRGNGRAPKSTLAWLTRPGATVASPRFQVRVRGFADDSVAGWNVTVTLRRKAAEGAYSTASWVVRGATRQLVCARGTNPKRTLCR